MSVETTQSLLQWIFAKKKSDNSNDIYLITDRDKDKGGGGVGIAEAASAPQSGWGSRAERSSFRLVTEPATIPKLLDVCAVVM